MSAVARIFGAVLAPSTREWVASFDNPAFTMGAGKSASDSAWRRAARAEGTVAGEGLHITLVSDFTKFYETVPHEAAIRCAAGLGAPPWRLRLEARMYRAPRVLMLGQFASRRLYPTRRVPAGSAFACALTQALTLGPLTRSRAILPPNVSVELCVDDSMIDAWIDPCSSPRGSGHRRRSKGMRGGRQGIWDLEQTLVTRLAKAAACVYRALVTDARVTLSIPKTFAICSTGRLATLAKRQLGEYGVNATTRGVNLGVDCTAGGRRPASGALAMAASRAAAGRRRTRRARTLAFAAPWAARKLLRTNLGPVQDYGAAVCGISDAALRGREREAGALLRPRTKGRSLAATLLVHEVLLERLSFASTLRWAEEVWRAGLPRSDDSTGALSVSELASVWRRVRHRGIGRTWRKVAGPASAVLAELRRAGWHAPSPFVLRTDEGVELNLFEVPPTAIRAHCAESRKRGLRQRAAVSLGSPSGCIWEEPVLAALRDKSWTAREKGAALAVATGACWTRTRLAKAGLSHFDTRCPMCMAGADTMAHRRWECPFASDARSGCFPRGRPHEEWRQDGNPTNAGWLAWPQWACWPSRLSPPGGARPHPPRGVAGGAVAPCVARCAGEHHLADWRAVR